MEKISEVEFLLRAGRRPAGVMELDQPAREIHAQPLVPGIKEKR